MIRSSVVLPQPLSPTSETISFSPTSKPTLRSTGRSELPLPSPPRTRKVFETSWTRSFADKCITLCEHACGVIEQLVDREAARDELLHQRHLDCELERPAHVLDAEAQRVEL